MLRIKRDSAPAVLTATLAAAFAAAFGVTDTFAEPVATPSIEGGVAFELQSDLDYDSNDATNKRGNVFLKVEPEATVHLPAGFSIYAHGVIEQVNAADPGDDRYFEDEALYVQDLYLRYENGPFTMTGGKLNPGFGRAWDTVPGIYGTDATEDYEFAERIGVTASYDFGTETWGKHRLAAGTFFLDTTALAHSLVGTSRGTVGRADGGVSNTEDFSSFNVVLEGGGIAALPGLDYHVAYIHQDNGVDGTTAETGAAGYLAYAFELEGGITVTPMAEVVRFDDSGGASGIGRGYETVALSGKWQSWNAVLSYTRRVTEVAGAGDVRDHFYQVDLGYSFDFGLTADIAWKRARESAVETDTFGTLFTYAVEF